MVTPRASTTGRLATTTTPMATPTPPAASRSPRSRSTTTTPSHSQPCSRGTRPLEVGPPDTRYEEIEARPQGGLRSCPTFRLGRERYPPARTTRGHQHFSKELIREGRASPTLSAYEGVPPRTRLPSVDLFARFTVHRTFVENHRPPGRIGDRNSSEIHYRMLHF